MTKAFNKKRPLK